MTILDDVGMFSGSMSVCAYSTAHFIDTATGYIMLGVAVVSGVITIVQGAINIYKTIKKFRQKKINQEQAIEEIEDTLEEVKEDLNDGNNCK